MSDAPHYTSKGEAAIVAEWKRRQEEKAKADAEKEERRAKRVKNVTHPDDELPLERKEA